MWLKVCGGALLCAVAVLLLKNVKSEVLPLQWAGNIMLSGAALLLLQPTITYLGELCSAHGMGETVSLLLRGLGVAMMTQFCADLCRQSGETVLANSVELAGKAEILLLCLPQMRELVELAGNLIGNR